MRRIYLMIIPLMLAGCFAHTAAVSGRAPMDEVSVSSLGGNYSIASFNAPYFELTTKDFVSDKRFGHLFGGGDKDVIQLSIKVTSGETRTGLGGIGVVNDLVSVGTFFGWPLYDSDYRDYEVYIDSCLGHDRVRFTVEKSRWLTVWTPLGWVPLLFNSNSATGENLSDAAGNELWTTAAKQGTLDSVASVLRRDRYDAFFSERQKARKEETRLRREAILREFAIKEAPEVWRTLRELQGKIEQVDVNLTKLRSDLIEFNRDPEHDADYLEIAQLRKEMQDSRDKMWRNLENAYIAYMKFRATPSQKEYADTMNRALEDGVHEAEAIARRYSVMSIEK